MVTATAMGKSDTAQINFIEIESISLRPKHNMALARGAVTLTATVKETGGITSEDVDVVFSADNGATLTPPSGKTKSGVITTDVTSNRVGTTMVTATAMGKSDTAQINFMEV
jgi:hypothetical protein